MKRGKLLTILLALAAVPSLAVTPANAASVVVNVQAFPSGSEGGSGCRVSIPLGSNAIVALDAAVAATRRGVRHCHIRGYRLWYDTHLHEHSVRCVARICDTGSLVWEQFENSRKEYFVEDFRADAGDTLLYEFEECFCTFPFYT